MNIITFFRKQLVNPKILFGVGALVLLAAITLAVQAEVNIDYGGGWSGWNSAWDCSGGEGGACYYIGVVDPGPPPIPVVEFEWTDRSSEDFACKTVHITANQSSIIGDNLPCKGSYTWQPQNTNPTAYEIRYKTATRTVCQPADETCGYREFYDVVCRAPNVCKRTEGAGDRSLDLITVTYATSTGPLISQSGSKLPTGPLKITKDALSQPLLGKYYFGAIEADGGVGAYIWSLTGNLPLGVTGEASSCADPNEFCRSAYLLQGVPTTKGTYTFTVSLTDGKTTISKSYTIVISSAEPVKLVEIGWDSPAGHTHVKDYLEVLEKKLFDVGNLIHRHFLMFSKKSYRFTYEEMKPEIDGINAVRTATSKPMFIQIDASSGVIGHTDVPDWFNDADWENTLHNVRMIARMGKETGAHGIVFDPEDYSGSYDPTQGMRLWYYANRPDKGTTTFSEYAQKVYERGRQFIQTINAEMPNIPVITYWCFESPNIYSGDARARYSLLPAFCDGMIQAADGGTVIHNATENAYRFTSEADFIKYKEEAHSLAKQYSVNPARLDKHYKVGFGIWERSGSYSAAAWENMVSWAMKHSEGYVWTYTEKRGWWITRHITVELPQAYQDSQFRARNKYHEGLAKPPKPATISAVSPQAGPSGSIFSLEGSFEVGSFVVLGGKKLPSEVGADGTSLSFRVPPELRAGKYSLYVAKGPARSADAVVTVLGSGQIQMASGPQLPRAFTAIPGGIHVPLGSLALTARNEAVTLNQLGLRFTAKNLSSITKFTVWDGAQKVVEGVPRESVVIPIRNVFVPVGLAQILTVTVDLSESAAEDSLTVRYEPTTTHGIGQLSRNKVVAGGAGGRMGGTVRIGSESSPSLSIYSPLLIKPSGSNVSYFLTGKNFTRTELRFICSPGISTRDKNVCGLDQELDQDGIFAVRFDNDSSQTETVYARYRGFDGEDNVTAQRTIPVRIIPPPNTVGTERSAIEFMAGAFLAGETFFKDASYKVRDFLLW